MEKTIEKIGVINLNSLESSYLTGKDVNIDTKCKGTKYWMLELLKEKVNSGEITVQDDLIHIIMFFYVII